MFGILNIYKPTKITSFDVVRIIRKLTNEKKVGHCGTLDPEACGVLPICIGKATKAIDYIMENNKVYVAELKLGEVTDTYDIEGKVIRQCDVNVTVEEVMEAVYSFKGNIKQVPPMYSALKVNGKKLYELAREGIEIEREARSITIHDIKVLEINLPYVKMEVNCSKGTYIRSLCYDIGEKLGCGAMMSALERTATGKFTKENSINIESLNKENIYDYIIPIENAFLNYPKVVANIKFKTLLLNGVILKDKSFTSNILKDEIYRVYDEENNLVGIGRKNDVGFKLIKVLV
ncbi:tRNA pseudouridine(55) synthase TruB [Clostridium argentinense]|uniref:tRNA pseudouridine(55) synthase TruB n=1 Tax=Clostridium argentinense TaxID=29341 RepID=UPI00057E20D4|nr:tRNA pseudouridine(55) synthase TruB [Clostridium argentinense]ARC87054.1 tRNA pseudouridine(55) synthase [Clostridium argentinense]NFF41694.1 tRNA pseudouridine(55) synthase TruB [Clostridium argentinense]NFP50811.1 tRNA pseudouridine(55) synthase TruB [Clostridium argentinense]NFP73032.1 tRNA pseudouridine(55) synthase TruB [Clostridium argentinense]NFP76293.1 tRNA pseudouridine(55) synthase TruB [Clostridium argentinense]